MLENIFKLIFLFAASLFIFAIPTGSFDRPEQWEHNVKLTPGPQHNPNYKHKIYNSRNCEYMGDSWINYRCRVKGGWIIISIYGLSISNTFMPDKDHRWKYET